MLRAERRRALLTVDLEDYRSLRLRDHGQVSPTVHTAELEREVHLLLELFDSLGASATFFCVGRLAADLAPSVWQEIVRSHPLGAHSFEHERVWQLGARRFEEDLRRTRAALEQVSGREVLSYRAPYFSNHGCNPWFGELLARAGIVIDSSQRLMLPPRGFRRTLPLLGSDELVTQVPFPLRRSRGCALDPQPLPAHPRAGPLSPRARRARLSPRAEGQLRRRVPAVFRPPARAQRDGRVHRAALRHRGLCSAGLRGGGP